MSELTKLNRLAIVGFGLFTIFIVFNFIWFSPSNIPAELLGLAPDRLFPLLESRRLPIASPSEVKHLSSFLWLYLSYFVFSFVLMFFALACANHLAGGATQYYSVYARRKSWQALLIFFTMCGGITAIFVFSGLRTR